MRSAIGLGAIGAGLLLLMSACQSSGGGTPGTSEGDDSKLTSDRTPQKCGANTCGVGQVCCNASCGICTKPDGACVQLACEADSGSGATSCAAVTCPTGSTCVEMPTGARCIPGDEDPCDGFGCPPNAVCRVQQGAAVCAPVPVGGEDAGNGGVKPPACAVTLCPAGTTCDDSSGAARCVTASPGCAAALCPAGTVCDDSSGSVQCVKAPACTAKCPAGQHCEFEEVQCITAPCPPQPTCVPDATTDPCATVRCGAGTHCETKQVQCIKAPCPPVAECVPDASGGTACGPNTCGAGSYCCNASCGICAPKGGACIQVACP
ncbi:MAG TPA: hypothetical protein VFZ61_19755 [Polyangiales bacterium]